MNPLHEPAVHPLRGFAAELPPAPSLESMARDRLLRLTTWLAFLSIAVGFSHVAKSSGWVGAQALAVLTEIPTSGMSAWLLAIATGFFLFMLRLLLPRLPMRWAHPLGTFVSALIVVNALSWFTHGITPEKSVPLAFAVFGAGCLLFTPRSLVLVMGIAVGGWWWFAHQVPFTEDWAHFGTALVGACLMAFVFQNLHLQTVKRMLRTIETDEDTYGSSAARADGEHFRRWYEATFEGIAIHERGVILEVNHSLGALLRCEPASLAGQNLLDWFTRASRDVIGESILLGNFRPFEAVARRPDKTELHVELYTKRIHWSGRDVMVTAFRDITERQRAAAALAAEQVRLQQQYRRQVALARLAVNIGETTEVARALSCIAETGATVLPASAGACVLVYEGGTLSLAASHMPRAEEAGFDPIAQLARVSDWIRENRETFVASKIMSDDPFEVNRPVELISAYVGVPLLDGRAVLGIFYVLEADEARHFKPDEMDFITELAGRAALAIAKARLFDELSETKQRLERQSALLLVQNEQLARAKTEAEAANEAKSEFLARISHELRTPMNGVVGMTDYLLTTGLNADQRESAEAVRESAERLMKQIDRILDFSRLETGTFASARVEFDIRETARRLITRVEECCGTKQIALRWNVDENVPLRLYGDAGALQRSLWNLLDNAVRFTEEGEVILSVTCDRTADGIVLVCAVRDSGPGITAPLRERIFDSFAQADNSLARGHEGLGLGLATTKRLVERMRGTISIESTPGKGTVFTIAAPFGLPEPVAAAGTN